MAEHTRRRPAKAGHTSRIFGARGILDYLVQRRVVPSFLHPLLPSAPQSADPSGTAAKGVEALKEPEKPEKPAPTWEATALAALDQARGHLSQMAKGGRPILVGPWISEVGFELLYWIPFLQWVKKRWKLPDDRLVVISRGGARPWYANLTPHYADVLDYFTPEQFLERNQVRIRDNGGGQKQVNISPFEEEILEKVKGSLGLSDVAWLHPGTMYTLFSFYWKQRAPLRWAWSLSAYQKPKRLPAGEILRHLPKDYVAVKFYFSQPFPDTPENRAFVVRVLKNLAEQTNVVLLSTGLTLDDHAEFTDLLPQRLYTIEDKMAPSNNLEVQTQVIQGAQAFVGTYGGFSYLAPLYGVDAVAFYSHPERFEQHHLDLAHRVFTSLGGTTLTALNVRDADRVAATVRPTQTSALVYTDQLVAEVETTLGTASVLETRGAGWDELHKRAAATERKLASLARSEKPIVVGPWLGEVGFEVLYWIPFLRWAVAKFRFPLERMSVVSRGGVRSWYTGLASGYYDIFDFMSPEEFRIKNDERTGPLGGLKQSKVLSPFEQEVLGHVTEALGRKDVDVLHPSLMYGLLRPYYKSQAGIDYLEAFTTYDSLPQEHNEALDRLPRDYVAAKFYFSPNFPDSPENRRFVETILATLREQREVVLLNTGLRMDDHTESVQDTHGFHTVADLITPSNNLQVQAQVISRAHAFVGTYGGLSYLAPFYGVDSLAFYSEVGPFNPRHLALAKHVTKQPGSGSLTMLDARDYQRLQQLFQTPGVTAEGVPRFA